MSTEDKDLGDIQIRFIPQAYDEYDGEASALRLLYALYPDWASRPGSVKIKAFTEGIMNTVCFQLFASLVLQVDQQNLSSS